MRIDKSPEARKKEKQIAELEQQLKRTRATLKGLKTRLANMQSRIESTQRGVYSKISRIQERIVQLSKDLEQLAGKLRKDKRLGREDRDLIDQVYQGMVKALKENMPDLEAMGADREEETEAKFRDAFKEFGIAPPPEEQRDIRRLYLGLSKQFHPDRARDEKEREQFHHLQQQINEAYQTHDFQTLIDLEQLWETPEDLAPATLDALDSKISRLENQLYMLKQQQERLSGEIHQLRNSDMGLMLTQADGMERAGFSWEESMPIRQLEEMISMLEKMQTALEETDRLGHMSPLFQKLTAEITNPVPSLMDMLLGTMGEFGEDVEDFFFDEEDEEDFLPNPNPRFPAGTAVRVVKKSEEYYVDERERDRFFSIKGYAGTVTMAYLDEEDRPVYDIDLDIDSMKRLPAGYIKFHGASFRNVELIREDALIKEPRRQDSPGEALRVCRELLYRHLLADLPGDQKKRLWGILLAAPEKSDELNWLAYLEEHLPLPFPARTRGLFAGFAPGRKAKVTDSLGYSPEDGFIVMAKIGNQQLPTPLAELAGTDNGPVAMLLDDYLAWFEVLFYG